MSEIQTTREKPRHELENALRLQDVLTGLSRQSQEMKSVGFSSEDEAIAAAEYFGAKVITELNEVEAKRYIVSFYGPGVHVPDVSIIKGTQDGVGTGSFVAVDSEKPLYEIDSFDERKGTVYSVNTQVTQTDAGHYHLKPSLIINLQERIETGIPLVVGGTYDFVVMDIGLRALVELNSDTRFSIEYLEKRRKKQEEQAVLDSYKQMSLSRADFGKYVNKLDAALYSENARQLVALRKPQIIRQIGKFGALFAQQGSEESEIVSRVILHRLGIGRQLSLVYEKNAEDSVDRIEVDGVLVEVIMSTSLDNSAMPAFVVEPIKVQNGKNDIEIVPLDRVTALSF
jgi:hypothetical protein